MNSKRLSLIRSLITSGIFVFKLHTFMLFDSCLDAGGIFDEENSTCMSGETYESLYLVVTWPLTLAYAVFGVVFMGISWFLVYKALNLLRLRGNEI